MPWASSYELLAWKAMRGLARSSSGAPPRDAAAALAGISRLDAAGTLVRKARAVGIAIARTLRRACTPSMERSEEMALGGRVVSDGLDVDDLHEVHTITVVPRGFFLLATAPSHAFFQIACTD